MILITTIITFIFLVFSIFKEKNVYNPLTLFLLLWTMICLLASLQLFGMYKYSYKAPLIILIGVSAIYCGYLSGKKYKIKMKKIPLIGIEENASYELRRNLLSMLLVGAILVYITMAVSVIALLASGFDASTIRELYRDSGETALSGMASSMIYGSQWLKYLDSYFAKPIVFVSIPIMSIEIIENGKMTKVIILSAVALSLSMFVNFGRTNVLVVIASIISAFLIQKKKLSKKAKRRIKSIAIIILIFSISFFIYLSNFRESGSNSNKIQNLYAYFSIPVPLLDYWIKKVDYAHAYSLGFSYISGFIANLMNILNKFDMKFGAYKVAELYNYNLVDHFINVFPNFKYNAYVSMFFAFYLDFREIGVLCGSFGYGYIISRCYSKASKKKIYLAFYLLLLQSLIWSFIRWHFVIVAYCFSFILMRILFKKK